MGGEVDELVPPAIFGLEFYLDDKDKSSLTKASSGEFQLLGVLSSLLYHIRNIESVNVDNRYRNITLILDEIELYFHPDMQRYFVKRLLDALSKMEPDIFGLHILFSTHSPFILSDMQQQNILKLEKGIAVPPNEDYNTFAANIHDLLADEFFLTESSIGAFAQKKITNAISLLNYLSSRKKWESYKKIKKRTREQQLWIKKWEHEMNVYCKRLEQTEFWSIDEKKLKWDQGSDLPRIKALINSIGEPIIKGKILSLYQMAFPESTPADDIYMGEMFR